MFDFILPQTLTSFFIIIILFCIFRSSLNITRYTYKGAAEQKALSTYEYLIDLTDNPEVLAPLRFLREREIVHFQRFGEALDIARDYLNQQHYFFMQNNGCNK